MMAQPVAMWRDLQGFLHETAEGADNANAMIERNGRRAVVHGMLVRKVQEARADGVFVDSSAAIADWLIETWPSLKLIGYAYRMDDLTGGEAAVPVGETAAP